MAKLKKLRCQQKEALRMIFNKDKFESGPNIFQEKYVKYFRINIFQTAVFRYKTKNQLNPTIFTSKFQSNTSIANTFL